jgi:structural maintenance of chromosome 3 (chondroitin sulfate proteoglycan 6)
MKKKKDALQNERNVLWRTENGMQQQIGSLREELSKKEQALRSITGKVSLIVVQMLSTLVLSHSGYPKWH